VYPSPVLGVVAQFVVKARIREVVRFEQFDGLVDRPGRTDVVEPGLHLTVRLRSVEVAVPSRARDRRSGAVHQRNGRIPPCLGDSGNRDPARS
jgi:hypothetical protein